MKKLIRLCSITLLGMMLMLWGIGIASAQTLNAPTDLRVTQVTDTSLSLRWNDNSTNESHYRLERSDDNGLNWLILADLPANETNYVDTGFLCDTTYRYRVRAYIESSNLFSSESSLNLSLPISCAASNLQVEVLSQFTLRLSWVDNSSTEWGFNIEEYSPMSDSWMQVASTEQNGSSVLIPYDCTEELGVYRVVVESAFSFYNYSEVISITLPPCIDSFVTETSCELQPFNTGIETDSAAPGPVVLSGNGSRMIVHFNYPEGDGYNVYSGMLVFDIATQSLIFEEFNGIWGDMDYSGERMVFLSIEDYNGGDMDYHNDLIYWENGNIQQITNLYDDPEIGVPQISDDGSVVVFSANGLLVGDPSPGRFIYIWDAVNGLRKLIEEARFGEVDIASPDVLISGDGSTVTFLHDGSLSGRNDVGETQLYLWDALTGLRLMYPFSDDFDPYGMTLSINADGSRISFTDSIDPIGVNPDGNDEIFIWDADTGLRQLTEDYSGSTNFLSASLDGTGNRLLLMSALPLDADQGEPYEGGYFLYDQGYGFSQLTFGIEEVWPIIGSVVSADGSKIAVLQMLGWDGVESPYLFVELYVGDCTSTNAIEAPTELQMTAIAVGTYSLSWLDNSPNETAFYLERSYDGIEWTEIAQLPADSTSYIDSGLYCNITYFYRVRAYDGVNGVFSAYSNVPSDYIPCFTIFPPSNFQFTEVGETSVSMSWTDNAVNEAGFEVERSSDGISWTVVAQLPANSTSYTDEGLECNAAYSYRLRAYHNLNIETSYSDYTNPIEAYTLACLILEAPSNISLTDSQQNSLSFSWTDNSSLETTYEVERSLDGVNWVYLSSPSFDSTSYTDSGLNCSTAYQYRIRTMGGNSQYSPYGVSEFFSTAACSPLVASVLSSTGTTESSIGLSWTVDTTATSFTLAYFDGINWQNLGIFPETTTIYSHNGLSCGQNYQYRVTTYRAQDNASVESMTLSASTTVCPAPNTPDAPIVLSSDLTVVNLQIPALPAGASSMNLERSSDGINWTSLGAVLTGTMSDGSVVCGTAYQYRLVAYSGAGAASLPSALASAMTRTCLTPSLVGVYRAGLWIIVQSDNPSTVVNSFNFGSLDAQPLVGDWDGDGVDGIGIYQNGQFTLRNLASADAPESIFTFATVQGGGWQAIAGDWNGDGVDSVGLYKNGEFVLSNDNQQEAYRFVVGDAQGGWIAVAGDWNGDGSDGLGLYKQGNWLLVESVSSPSSQSLSYGPNQGGWLPVVSDWNDDGSDSIGLYKDGAWRLRTNNAYDTAEIMFSFGQAGDIPFVLDESGASGSGSFVIP